MKQEVWKRQSGHRATERPFQTLNNKDTGQGYFFFQRFWTHIEHSGKGKYQILSLNTHVSNNYIFSLITFLT